MDKRQEPRKQSQENRSLRAPDQRRIVLDILTRIRTEDVFSHIAVREALEQAHGLGRSERAFVKRLAEGVIERRIELDGIIKAHCRSTGRLRPVIADILRMGVYQICYMDNVPDSAACNEAVALTKSTGRKEQAGFVNGLLRSVAREHAEGKLINSNGEDSGAEGLSKRYSMPAWIVQMWTEQLGNDVTEQVLEALLAIHPVSIRMDERLSEKEREKAVCDLESAGIQVRPGRYLPYAYVLEHLPALRTAPGFSQGLWTVQDESSMLVAEAAGLQGGETVLDLCAAPGGKMLHIASKLAKLEKETGRAGSVFAYDKSMEKVRRMQENAVRMKVENVHCAVRDAAVLHEEDLGKADLVLCDVPCSGLGVAGKKRDIKYRVTEKQIEELLVLQRRILSNAVQYLKKGGVLLFSTCTVNRSENEDNARYIEKELGLCPDPLEQYLPSSIPGLGGGSLQLLPGIHGTDGFFIARFIREE